MPDQTTYFVGDTLSTVGLELSIPRADGTTEIVTQGYSATPATLTSPGVQTVTVSYHGVNTTFEVTVCEPEPCSISIETLPTNLKYHEGDTIDTTGLTLKVVYNNGTAQIIDEGFTITPDNVNDARNGIITVEYQGLEASFSLPAWA